MRYFALIVCVLLFRFAYSQTIKNNCVYFADNVTKKECFEFVVTDGKALKNGIYQSFYENGNLKSEGKFIKGKPSGIWTFYYESGKIKSKGNYNDKKIEGIWTYYFENGNIKSVGEFKNGLKNNNWIYNYENGNIKSKGEYVNNQKNGLWINYDSDGNFKSQGYFDLANGMYEEKYNTGKTKIKGEIKEGIGNGKWFYFHKNDSIEAIGNEKNGERDGKWIFYFDNGKIQAEGEYTNGQKYGWWKYYSYEGIIASEGEEIKGVRNGLWKVYDKKGLSKGECNFINGTGFYAEYYPLGKIRKQGKIVNNQNEGEWLYFDEEGNIEGKCIFSANTGYYQGFYKSGKVKIEGNILNGKKDGVWKYYNELGDLIINKKDYYEFDLPINDQERSKDTIIITKQIVKTDTIFIERKPQPAVVKNKTVKPSIPKRKVNDRYAIGLFLSSNPVATYFGQLPISAEYIFNSKFGIATKFTYFNSPFFKPHTTEVNQVFSKGYSFDIRSIYYTETHNLGSLYVGVELKYREYTKYTHFIDSVYSATTPIHLKVTEERYSSSILIGNKFTRSLSKQGIMLDFYVGIGIGKRTGKTNWDNPIYDTFYKEKNKGELYIPFRLGALIGYLF